VAGQAEANVLRAAAGAVERVHGVDEGLEFVASDLDARSAARVVFGHRARGVDEEHHVRRDSGGAEQVAVAVGEGVSRGQETGDGERDDEEAKGKSEGVAHGERSWRRREAPPPEKENLILDWDLSTASRRP
jgi:hypothetical protein